MTTIRIYNYANREEWLADRKNFIGASEVASVIGAPGAYSSRWELWARKSGRLPDKPETESMRWGSILEAAIGQGVQAEHGGYVISSPDVYDAYGPEDKPHQRATPDCTWRRGEVVWLLEVKNVDRMLAEHWDDAPPPHVVVQLQWQMYCCG
ncbi:MAG: YqaJ viral recombinase family protein, partial [Planctomycetota bacterium]